MASIRIGIPPTCGGWNTGPPKVGQVPYPGSFCCAELLAGQGLHAVRLTSDSYSALRARGGSRRSYGPPFGAAARDGQGAHGCRPGLKARRHRYPAPNSPQAVCRGPLAGYLPRPPCPSRLRRAREPGLRPHVELRPPVATLRLAAGLNAAPPPGCRLDRGCAPTEPAPGRLSLRSWLASEPGSAAPRSTGAVHRRLVATSPRINLSSYTTHYQPPGGSHASSRSRFTTVPAPGVARPAPYAPPYRDSSR